MNSNPTQIAVTASNNTCQPQAQQLAGSLELPYLPPDLAHSSTDRYPLLLVCTPDYLELRRVVPPLAAVHIEWLQGRMAYRLRQPSREAIARAVGIKANQRPSIVDMTAGLGRDAFVLASFGCQVSLLERSPIIAALLRDALQRTQQHSEQGQQIAQRMQLHCTHSADYLHRLNDDPNARRPDVIYLDPMYPERKKSALVKKESQLLRAVVGDDTDADSLLTLALSVAQQRVVVKRPVTAPELAALTPSHCITGKNTRFDVYMC